jgi:glycosyltransferase involved in cell wall biosynthesis
LEFVKPSSLYICYYNVTEPLVKTQVVAYLKELAKRGVEIHLLTFEKENLSTEKENSIREELSQSDISWHWLRYHQRPSLPATVYDIAIGTIKAFLICRRNEIEFVHARSHVAAAMALWLKKIFGFRFLFDVRGLLAEEYADAGHWREGELKFRLTKKLETVFFRRADAFVMLTHRIKEELTESEPELRNRTDDITVIPCCVDTTLYPFDEKEREAYRKERGWTNRRVLTYVGKIGTWYLTEEMAKFFAVVHKEDKRFFFQILTQSDSTPIRKALKEAGVSEQDYDIRYAPPDLLPKILNASDAGLSFIKACYSKQASSPTKVGEYLAAGLPVVANAGVGDCDTMFTDSPIGVLLKDFNNEEFQNAAARLTALLDDGRTRERCRAFAEKEFSLSKVGGPRYAAVYSRIFGTEVLTTNETQASITSTNQHEY